MATLFSQGASVQSTEHYPSLDPQYKKDAVAAKKGDNIYHAQM